MQLPGKARSPVGVYDHPADDDVPFLHSTEVGDHFYTRWAQKITGATNDVADWLDENVPSPIP